MWQDSSVILRNQPKETQKKKKKEHDDLISSMNLGGLGKTTSGVDFGREQPFPKIVTA